MKALESGAWAGRGLRSSADLLLFIDTKPGKVQKNPAKPTVTRLWS
jgi:hypothetical protein